MTEQETGRRRHLPQYANRTPLTQHCLGLQFPLSGHRTNVRIPYRKRTIPSVAGPKLDGLRTSLRPLTFMG